MYSRKIMPPKRAFLTKLESKTKNNQKQTINTTKRPSLHHTSRKRVYLHRIKTQITSSPSPRTSRHSSNTKSQKTHHSDPLIAKWDMKLQTHNQPLPSTNTNSREMNIELIVPRRSTVRMKGSPRIPTDCVQALASSGH